MSGGESKQLPPRPGVAPEVEGFGKPDDCGKAAVGPGATAAAARDELAQAMELAREAAGQIVVQLGPGLDRAARLKVARAFERVLVQREKRRRGRKRDAAITAAVADYEAGMRGQQLYQKHIRGYSGMGRYRRQSAIRTLNEAIRSRRRREHRDVRDQF